jgi:phosphatidate cytidylyltransferase
MDDSVPVPLAVRTSDLKVRTISAIVMLAVAGGALWAGGIVLQAFIALVAAATFGEFVRLIWKATAKPLNRMLGLLAGLGYISVAVVALVMGGQEVIIRVVSSVIAVDTFAYFFGRAIGGPKIAPRISPSKTWAGLLGGAFGASVATFAFHQGLLAFHCWRFRQLPQDQQQFGFDGPCSYQAWSLDLTNVASLLLIGFVIAVVAQCGDFFESWLKRKAGVKDSSSLIPGHGGVFDRTDGLLAVSFVVGIMILAGLA